jgi:hypothetical protein
LWTKRFKLTTTYDFSTKIKILRTKLPLTKTKFRFGCKANAQLLNIQLFARTSHKNFNFLQKFKFSNFAVFCAKFIVFHRKSKIWVNFSGTLTWGSDFNAFDRPHRYFCFLKIVQQINFEKQPNHICYRNRIHRLTINTIFQQQNINCSQIFSIFWGHHNCPNVFQQQHFSRTSHQLI